MDLRKFLDELPDAERPNLRSLLEKIGSSDRESGLRALRELQSVETLTPEEALLCLERAAADYEDFGAVDPVEVLITAAWRAPDPRLIPHVDALYPDLSAGARSAALALLTRIGDQEAIDLFIRLLRRWGWPKDVALAVTQPLEEDRSHAETLFPALCDGSIAGDPILGYSLCLEYLHDELLSPAVVEAMLPGMLARFESSLDEMAAAQQDKGVAWMWDEDYQERRHTVSLLLDIMGYLPRERVQASLERAVSLRDPRLKHFALTSLMRLGCEVAEADLRAVAASREMRGWLLERLRELGRPELFPVDYLNQAALAEWDMVQWLIFPTELGREPDEIELMRTKVERDEDYGGEVEYFVFRFCTSEPHWAAEHGWIAGVSGPFRVSEQPTLDALGETFSEFKPWEQYLAELNDDPS